MPVNERDIPMLIENIPGITEKIEPPLLVSLFSKPGHGQIESMTETTLEILFKDGFNQVFIKTYPE